jgi:hypothetical protein
MKNQEPYGEGRQAIEHHAGAQSELCECFSCQAAQARASQTFADFAAWSRAVTQLPDDFWRRQRDQIAARMNKRDHGLAAAAPKLAWGVTAAIGVVALILLMRPAPPPAVVQTPSFSDHDLLVSVERTINSDVPASLEPAALLAVEMENSFHAGTAKSSLKESSHEN